MPPSYPLLHLLRIAASGIVAVVSYAMLIPLTAIRLERGGASAAMVGLFAAMLYLAVLVASPFVAAVARRLGPHRLFVWPSAILPFAVLVFALTNNFVTWCLVNLVIGLVTALRWIVSESWVADLAPADRRGRVVGLYETALGLSFTAGPLVLLAVGTESPLPFIAAALLFALSWLLSLGLKPARPFADASRTRLRGFGSALAALPVPLVAAFVGGVYEAGLTGIGTYYGLTLGLGAGLAAMVAAVIGAGSTMAQFPIGWLADKIPARVILIVSLTLLMVLAALTPVAAGSPVAFLAAASAWGALGGGLYTLAMIQVATIFTGPALLRATAAIIFAYTLGSTIGPVLAGAAIEASPRFGLPAALGALAALALAALAGMRFLPPPLGSKR